MAKKQLRFTVPGYEHAKRKRVEQGGIFEHYGSPSIAAATLDTRQ